MNSICSKKKEFTPRVRNYGTNFEEIDKIFAKSGDGPCELLAADTEEEDEDEVDDPNFSASSADDSDSD
jgi:hypothetical protein